MSYFTYSAILVIAFFTNYSEVFAGGEDDSLSEEQVVANLEGKKPSNIMVFNNRDCEAWDYVSSIILKGDGCKKILSLNKERNNDDDGGKFVSVATVSGSGVTGFLGLCRGEGCQEFVKKLFLTNLQTPDSQDSSVDIALVANVDQIYNLRLCWIETDPKVFVSCAKEILLEVYPGSIHQNQMDKASLTSLCDRTERLLQRSLKESLGNRLNACYNAHLSNVAHVLNVAKDTMDSLNSDRSRGVLPTASQPQAAWQRDLLNGGKRPSAETPNVPDRSKGTLPTASQPQAAWQRDLLNDGKRPSAEIPNVPDNRATHSSVPRTPVVGTLVQYQPQQQHSHRPNPYKSNNHKHHHDNSGWKVVSGCKTYRHNNYYYRNIYGYCW